MKTIVTYCLLLVMLLTACNLGAETEVADEATLIPATNTPLPTNTPMPTNTPIPAQASISITTSCTPRTDWFEYTVQRGDTLFNIARRANSNVNTVAVGNCLADTSNIRVGQVLLVPNEIAASAYITYWMPTETATSTSVMVGCEQFVMPVQTRTLKTSDAATNIQNSLNALFNTPPSIYNSWAGQGLNVERVRIDATGQAVITIAGDMMLVGLCGDAVMLAQILLGVFAEATVQSAFITVNGQNMAQIFDMSGLTPADAAFTHASIPYRTDGGSCTPRTDWFEYTVQRGDTLFSIARRANSNVDTVARGNCLADPSNVYVGDIILVPNQIQAAGNIVYWAHTENYGANSALVGCDSIVSPIQTNTPKTNDIATNIQNSLNALFNSPPGLLNYWDGLGLHADSVTVDSNGRATVVISGDIMLVGTCSDALMKAQVLLSVFDDSTVQSAFITVNGQNLVQIFDMSGLKPANAVFVPFDIGYAE